MSATPAAATVLDREYLTIRSRLLELAAALDRIDGVSVAAGEDPRRAKIRHGLEVLLDGQADRAERVQLLFSLPYHERWREEFGLPAKGS